MPSSTFVLILRIRTKYQISKSLSGRGIDKTRIILKASLHFIYSKFKYHFVLVRSTHLLHYKVDFVVYGYKDVIKCAE